MLARLLCATAVLLIAAVPARGQTVDVSILIDDPATLGCDVTTAGLPVIPGIDARLTATVDRLAAQVVSVNLSLCSGASFGPPTLLGGGQPAGNDNGLSGADVVEMSVDRAAVTPGTNAIKVAALADNGAGADATGLGTFGTPLTAVPGLGLLGLAILALLMVALAWVALKRQRVVLSLMLFGMAFAVWAMSFMVDGQVGEWGTVPVLTLDPTGDATNNENAVDIVAVFVAQDTATVKGSGAELFFRVDMADMIINNLPPVAQDDALATDEDNPVSGDLFADNGGGADSDPDSDPFTVTMVAGGATVGSAVALPSGAQVTVNADGTFTYDPLSAFNALSQGQTDTDTFTYTIDDGIAGSDQGTATVTITGVNDVATAVADSYNTGEDTPLNQAAPGVLDNDTDPDANDTLTAVLDTGPASAMSFTLNPDGSFNYIPALNFTGSDSFTYHANDGLADSNVVTATINVGAVNDPPVAIDDSGDATDEDTAITTANVLTNDTDPELDPLSVVAFDTVSAQGAAVTNNGDGTFGYDPTVSATLNSLSVGQMTTDSFGYTVTDGFLIDTATVSVDVTGVNDTMTANDDGGAGFATDEDTAFTTGNVLGNDTDPDAGDTLSVMSADATSAQGAAITDNLDGTFSYDPTGAAALQALATGAMLTDTFSYTGTDGNGSTDTATVSIDVTGINDDPVIAFPTGGAVFNNLGPVNIDPAATLTDVDSPDMDTGDLTASLALSADISMCDVDDVLTVENQGMGAGQIGFDGTNVSFEGTQFGTVTTPYLCTDMGGGLFDIQPLLIAFDPNASQAAVLALLRALQYNTSSSDDQDREASAMVTDGDGGTSNAALTTITVNLNQAPVITSDGGGATSMVNAAENQTAVTTVTATDADIPAQNLTFSISGGADQGLFGIGAASGVLTFNSAPDFENPTDAGADNVYDVQVTVTDDGTPTLSDSQDIAVTVTDVNEAPTITSDGGGATASVNAAENQTAVTTVTATDVDLPAQTLTFTITGGADQALFGIGVGTGVLTFNSAPDFENPTDAGMDNVYDVQVTVTDNGAPNLSDVQDIAVTVTGINDAPVITSDGGGATATVNAAENQTAVTTTTATDSDVPAQTLTFSITGGADQALFGIGAGSGVLTFNSAPDFENPTDAGMNNVYDVQVTVTDNGAPNLSDTQDIAVTVTDVNDAPVITSDGGGATASANAAENQTAVTTVTATDEDLPAQTLTFSITGGADQALFGIGAGSGVLTFNSAPDFENPTDAGMNNVYDVQVTVTDNGVPNLSDVQDIAVTVTDVNDVPVITSDGGGATATVNAAENQTAVTTTTATDSDVPAQTLTFSITGGADQALFGIGAGSGVLTFNSAPDFENPTDAGMNNVYDVQVTVTDNGVPNLSDVQDIAVTVTDVNDVPVITSDGGGATATVNAAENQTAVTTTTATDSDVPAQTLTFSITGGADQALFGIGAGSGVLTFNSAPDFENPTDAGMNNVYDVQVTVTDNGVPNLSDVQDIAVTVTDVNDVPVITSDGGGATATVNAAENQTAVTTTTATDSDVPAQTLTFSITGGADQALFGIGAGSGVLTFNSAPDFENPTDAGMNNVYDVQVTVTDNGAPNLSDVQDIAVTVTNVNDVPVITSDGGGATATVNAAENQTAVTTTTATDSDVPAQTLTFSITGGADQALFGIGAGSGVLTFNSAPDFENPTDAGMNNVYDVQVTVTDNGAPNLSDVQDIAVTVTDVNEPPAAMNESFAVQSNVGVQPNAMNGLLANDSDPDAGDMVSLAAASIGGPFPTTQGGSITVAADGSFTYTPQAGDASVADTFAYTVRDIAGLTAPATATFNVDANTIWFVDLDAMTGGDGTLSNPFDSLADLDNGGPDANGDAIFHYSAGMGAQTDALSDDFDLQASQLLIGEGATGAGTINALLVFTTHPFSLTLPSIGAALNHSITSTANGGITLATGNTIRGLDIGNTGAGTGIVGSNFGTLTIDDVSISGTGGILNLSTGTVTDPTGGDFTFGSLATTSNPGIGIDLNAVGGGFTVNTTTSITGISGTLGIDVDGSSGSFDFGGVAISGGTDAGIDIFSSGAATFTFDSLSITNDSGAGLSASTGGTINIAGGGNTIASTGGAALDIDNTTLGGGGWTFSSLSSTNSAARGIDLTNLPAGSDLTVTGTTTVDNATATGTFFTSGHINISVAGAGSDIVFGVTNVTNRNGTGIFVNDMDGATLTFGATTIANPNSAGGYGIRVEDSSAAVTFAAANISDTNQTVATTDAGSDGVPDNEGDGDAIFLINNTGSFTLNGGTIQNLETDGIDIRSSSNIRITGVTINNIGLNSGNVNPTNDNGIFALNLSGSNLFRNGTISRFRAGGGAGQDDSGIKILNINTNFTEIRVDTVIFDNDLDGSLLGNRGFELTARGATNGNVAITGSTFRELAGDGVGFSNGNSSGSGTIDLVIANSTFSNAVIPPAGTFGGIQGGVLGTATSNVNISGATLQKLYPSNANNGMLGVIAVEDGNLIFTADNSDFFESDDGDSANSGGRTGIWLTAGNSTTPSDDPDTFDISINNSDFSDIDDEGIHIDVRGTAVTGGGQSAEIRLVDNQVGDDGAGGLLPVGRGGFELGAFLRFRNNAKTINLLVDGTRLENEDNSAGDETFDLDIEASVTVNSTATGNFFTSNGIQAHEFIADVEAAGATGCVDLRNNTASGPGAGTGTYLLDNGGGAFNANTSANSGTVNTAGTIGSVALCPLPFGKTIPSPGSVAQSTVVSTAFTALEVTLVEDDGTPGAAITVTFSAPGGGASGTFPSGNTCLTNGSGICSVPFTANATAGAYEVTASALVSGSLESAKFLLLNRN